MMRNSYHGFSLFLICLSFYIGIVQAGSSKDKPPIQHGISYKAVDDISLYWLSEKLDGMRGYWDGQQLLTRQGNTIFTPLWFTKNWPNDPIDGELWLARDSFQQTMSCVRKKVPEDDCWQQIKFMMFDLPHGKGSFTDRIKQMQHLAQQTNSVYLQMVTQFKLSSLTTLNRVLEQVTANKGEGLMLHLASAPYFVGRNAYVMKLKKYQDSEATVIARLQGKGKYQHMMGALQVETAKGIRFKIGSGFTDDERRNPPQIGSVITYQFNGKTTKGIPRFARFLRVRVPATTAFSNNKALLNGS